MQFCPVVMKKVGKDSYQKNPEKCYNSIRSTYGVRLEAYLWSWVSLPEDA